jgi:hypothetical protein
MRGERYGFSFLRNWILVGEVVDQLLNANSTWRRKLSLVQHAAYVGIGGCVYVHSKGRKRLGARGGEFVFEIRIVLFGAELAARCADSMSAARAGARTLSVRPIVEGCGLNRPHFRGDCYRI